MISDKKLPIYIAVFLFPVLIATVRHGGGTVYVLLLIAGLILGWSALQSLSIWEKRLLTGFLIFFLLLCISLINTQDFSSGFKKMERYLHFPLLIPMYLLLKKYQIDTGKVFLSGILLASVVMFIQAFYQVVILGWDRAVGAYNSLIIGDVSMLAAAIIACAVLTVSSNWRQHFICGLAIAMALSSSVLSGARGAWILLPVLTLWFLWIKRKNLGYIPLLSIVSITLLLIVGVFNVSGVKVRVDRAVMEFQNYSPDSTEKSSVGYRLTMWRDSLEIWKKHPIIGTGVGDFKSDRVQLFQDGKSSLEVPFGHAHSIYFDVLATTGIVGFIGMFVFMQLLPFRMFYGYWTNEADPWLKFYALSGMVTVISFAVFGLTEGWLARNMFVRTYLMCILVFMSSIAIIKMGGQPSKVNSV